MCGLESNYLLNDSIQKSNIFEKQPGNNWLNKICNIARWSIGVIFRNLLLFVSLIPISLCSFPNAIVWVQPICTYKYPFVQIIRSSSFYLHLLCNIKSYNFLRVSQVSSGDRVLHILRFCYYSNALESRRKEGGGERRGQRRKNVKIKIKHFFEMFRFNCMSVSWMKKRYTKTNVEVDDEGMQYKVARMLMGTYSITSVVLLFSHVFVSVWVTYLFGPIVCWFGSLIT